MSDSELRQRYFEDVAVGATLPTLDAGPLTLVDTVRWAGFQENTAQLHYDRGHVREHNGLPTFIASGEYREALLINLITDWMGPRGLVRRLQIRQARPTFEGDVMRFAVSIAEKAPTAADPWIACDVAATNQQGEEILRGRCTVTLPVRAAERD